MSQGHDSTTATGDSVCGRVKWFNSKAGYGFITHTNDSNTEVDVFVHHSSVITGSEQYKYLVQGEYVQFTLADCDGHDCQACDVRGLNGGKLMCETHFENRANRPQRPRRNNGSNTDTTNTRNSNAKQVVDNDGRKWTLVPQRNQNRNRKQKPTSDSN